ncbi:MAG: cytochrome c oxidase accessory protein CcoG [Maricaulaceae bacterium]
MSTLDARKAASSEAADGVERFDVKPVHADEHRSLYQAREPIYPKRVHGPFRKAKWLFLVLALGAYYLAPWIRWDRGPNDASQAILVDFGGRKLYFFGLEIWPQEFYLVTGVLILAGLVLFLVTSLFGRVWCGYACPQTVWTDLFIAVERWVEGDRNKRIALARRPWTDPDKLRKKALKHSIWLLIAFATGGAWIIYFNDAPTLARDFFIGQADLSAYMFAGILTFTTYSLAGLMREQVCVYMCPWPRIQAALTDEHALNVLYRYDRGEPRGAHKKGDTWEDRGDCIDCNACVVACPMGIDIREGSQLACIQCALCIDACDEIMEKVDRPKGLIAYDTPDNVERRLRGEKPQFVLFRARTIIYAVASLIVVAALVVGLAQRTDARFNVLRDRNPPFVALSDGSVRNGYTLKLLNKTAERREFLITAEGPEGLDLRGVGLRTAEDALLASVDADTVLAARVFLTLPSTALIEGETAVRFVVRDTASEIEDSADSVFLGPRNGGSP